MSHSRQKLLCQTIRAAFLSASVQGNISHMRSCWHAVHFPSIQPFPQAYGPSPLGLTTTSTTFLINSINRLPPPFLSSYVEEDISTNVSVVRALRGSCGGWWLAIDCFNLLKSKEAPLLAAPLPLTLGEPQCHSRWQWYIMVADGCRWVWEVRWLERWRGKGHHLNATLKSFVFAERAAFFSSSLDV